MIDPHNRVGPLGAAHALLDSSTDCVKAVGLDGALLGMNPEGMCLMEIEDFTPLRGQAWWSLWPEEHRPTLKAAVARAGRGAVARFSADCPTAKGVLKHWDVSVAPVHDAEAHLVSLLVISRDVTVDVRAAEERALVTRELAHRIANLFTVVDGVIGLSARADPACGPFAEGLRERLGGLSRAVNYVYAGQGGGLTLSDSHSVHGLLSELLNPYGAVAAANVGLRLSGEDHLLTPGAVTPLALVFNELATNALKYGALSTPSGHVALSSRLEGLEADRHLVIEWVESGGPSVTKPARRGFGSRLLERGLAGELAGRVQLDYDPSGVSCRMELPLQDLESSE